MFPLARQQDSDRMDGPSQLTELVGRTPLLDLSRLTDRPGVALYAKAEFANPGGSVKDRPGKAMVDDAVAARPPGPREADPGLDLRQHRDRLRLAGRRSGDPGHPLPALEREPRAQADPRRLRSRAAPDRPAAGVRRRDPRSAAPRRRAARPLRLPRPVLEPRELALALSHHRPRDPGADRRRASPTSSPASAPAALSSASVASCASGRRRCG